MAGRFRSSELVVELNGSLNQNFLFKPLMENLRGRWMVSRVKLGDTGALSGMPDLPGQHICVDVKQKSLRVVDPLDFPENEQLLAKANGILEAKNVGRGKMRPRDEINKNNLNDNAMKGLLWQLLELYDTGKLTVVQGTMPTRKQVLEMPGKLQLRYATSNQKTDKFCSGEELAELEERYGVVKPGDLAKA